ncbi:glycoside hydrolase family 76 protein [Dysgonomonas sp. Marseille-P4361]|uniref:glycoside hydrolase family 76 protein n=1 Tax=Dysgonomonas sp. Marseille-P4361 TaxID=2161820 RepID=UPI000D558ABD|nr:glycoside hydrolase family 76 protein [Dysgonomonas sp. Marseille-P4361]
MKKVHIVLWLAACCLLSFACEQKKGKGEEVATNNNLERAEMTLDSLYKHYSVLETNLLRENYPFKDDYKATYLASEEQNDAPNQYSYLWPYSGTFSAVYALFETSDDTKFRNTLDNKVLNGLEEYYDTKREPYGYASYINSAKESDRFYDDNVWLGIDFTDTYIKTKDQKYLDKAQIIWNFVMSGCDDKLGGGIYWCEQKKESKNTCSNAPGAVFALKLFEATLDSSYLAQGKELYEWTKKNLQDTDYVYFDNINLDGKISEAKYPYNSGQMMQAAALLHKITKENNYLEDAQNIAKGSYNYFFTDFTPNEGEAFKVLKEHDVWFIAVMLRGFVELYHLDGNKTYIDTFQKNLDFAWNNTRETNGLFNKDFSGKKKDERKWLLTQAAMVEMYARMGGIK